MSAALLPDVEQAPLTGNDSGLLERILRNVKIPEGQSELHGCWEYQKGVNAAKRGYCQINIRPHGVKSRSIKKLYVHRVILLLFGVMIEPGQQVDHTCRNVRCCNPDHLEPVTQQENLKRQRQRALECGNY